ncbi:MAG: transposase [Acidobacteriota bacterium]|nr:transposase [Acidobacteriota bacterium]
MIEVEDERVHQLVARATVAHLQKKCAYPAGVELRYRDEQTRLGDADENAPTRHQSRCVGKATEAGKKGLALCRKKEFLSKYDRIVVAAGKLYQPLQRKKGPATKPQELELPMVAAARKLVNRLGAKRDEILLFMTDFRVPFDNNQAERELRMLKVKQKISGCFRTKKGAAEFCRVRSYVSTMKKQGQGMMETIRSVYAGKTMMPLIS